jgi:hypothetical protein
MAANEIGAVSFADDQVTVSVTYNPNNLQVQQVAFQNGTPADCVIEVFSPAGLEHSYTLPAGTPSAQRGIGSDHIQLVQQTVTKTGGPVTFVTWPDGWSITTRWPA